MALSLLSSLILFRPDPPCTKMVGDEVCDFGGWGGAGRIGVGVAFDMAIRLGPFRNLSNIIDLIFQIVLVRLLNPIPIFNIIIILNPVLVFLLILTTLVLLPPSLSSIAR
jgi:hypothetical protein